MTFCIGICVDAGVVALSDTRIVRGSQISVKAKLSSLSSGDRSAVLMTSGLRSVRDKVAHRVQDQLDSRPVHRMHQLATGWGDRLREVRAEDGPSLADAGFTFNSHALIGGRLLDDERPLLLHVYPEGNWVEATADDPSIIIGRSNYGKPILDRLLRSDTPLDQAATLAYLAFDATRTSANDVDFPIDVAVIPHTASAFTIRRFTERDLQPQHDAWNQSLSDALDSVPSDWASELIDPPQQPPPTDVPTEKDAP
ncbi:proteasome-type protease [Ilumatobacter sp.]|uniref:proteasome-type protease n=1 Tax=Ilumatobacter sp. TaxID=1967498 RepID=UPI003C37A095